MPSVKNKLVIFAILALSLLTPMVSLAAASCQCFCGTEGIGAIDADATASMQACQETCSSTLTKFVGCYSDPTQYPDGNDRCWTKDQCAKFSTKVIRGAGEITVKAASGSVIPYNCGAAKSGESLIPQYHCYVNDVPFTLSVAIGSVIEVQNIPDYINTVYTWLLPAASLVAVVLMMLGGLQYVLARGKSKYIDAAKTRITNAITGLVLLLSAFVILNLIDPRLTSLKGLKIPLIKKVIILDAASSCENLRVVGYKVEVVPPASLGACGVQGKITGMKPEKSNAIGAWKVDQICDFTDCNTAGQVCVKDAGKNSCVSCGDVPTPTPQVCASLQVLGSGTTTVDFPKGGQYAYCSYDKTLNSCVGVQTSATAGLYPYIYCPTIQTLAKEKGGCNYYESLQVVTKDGAKPINAAPYAETLLKEICNSDPCKLGPLVSIFEGAITKPTTSNSSSEAGFVLTPTGCLYDNAPLFSCFNKP